MDTQVMTLRQAVEFELMKAHGKDAKTAKVMARHIGPREAGKCHTELASGLIDENKGAPYSEIGAF